MKIKILLAPTIIVITIVLCIWIVYPAYTNGTNGVKEKYQELKEQTRLSDNLDNQVGNVGKLSANLKSNTLRNAVVFGYIPQDKGEEKVIESLNLLAKDSGLSVLNISVFEIKNVVDPNLVTTALEAPPALSGTASDGSVQPIAATPIPKKMRVDFVVLGDYGGIKVLVEKIQKMNRFNKFSALEIKTLLKEDQTVSESLSVKIALEFNYLKELNILTKNDIDNPIFSTGVFDTQVIDTISKNKSIEVKNVLPGQKGTANPFLMIK